MKGGRDGKKKRTENELRKKGSVTNNQKAVKNTDEKMGLAPDRNLWGRGGVIIPFSKKRG